MSENELPNQNSNCSEHPMDYLNKAAEACAAGDMTLGLHLYLAEYEKAVSEPGTSTGLAVAALREAWHLACDLKERSMAEHVFEKLEPYLSREEIAECAAALQDLALDRLEQYGFSREELQDMAEAISHDFLGGDASVVKVEHITIPGAGAFGGPDQLFADVSIDVEQIAAPQCDATVVEEANEFDSNIVAAEAADGLPGFGRAAHAPRRLARRSARASSRKPARLAASAATVRRLMSRDTFRYLSRRKAVPPSDDKNRPQGLALWPRTTNIASQRFRPQAKIKSNPCFPGACITTDGRDTWPYAASGGMA